MFKVTFWKNKIHPRRLAYVSWSAPHPAAVLAAFITLWHKQRSLKMGRFVYLLLFHFSSITLRQSKSRGLCALTFNHLLWASSLTEYNTISPHRFPLMLAGFKVRGLKQRWNVHTGSQNTPHSPGFEAVKRLMEEKALASRALDVC